jgi:hypothetical protein
VVYSLVAHSSGGIKAEYIQEWDAEMISGPEREAVT